MNEWSHDLRDTPGLLHTKLNVKILQARHVTFPHEAYLILLYAKASSNNFPDLL